MVQPSVSQASEFIRRPLIPEEAAGTTRIPGRLRACRFSRDLAGISRKELPSSK